jgi:predicted metal-dependent enzyme (double-stranded beta helix superfamily)
MAMTAEAARGRGERRDTRAHITAGEPTFAAYARSVADLCDSCREERIAAGVSRDLRALVRAGDWLPPDCREPGDATYRRHLLYGDPAGRFTILAVVWRPGQGTPVHGHTAWGAVGVYLGNPSVANYHLAPGGGLELACEARCQPGDVACVQRGTTYPHRVFNDSDDLAITIHTYGRDLVRDPGAINILV